jgi:hypothetical protein
MVAARWVALGSCLSVAAWAAAPEPAPDEPVPPVRQALILMRALAYDENLAGRARGSVDVRVLFRKGQGASEQTAARMVHAFGTLLTTQVAGLPIGVASLAYGGPEPLRKVFEAEGIDAVYVCDGLEAELPAIAQITRRTKVLTMGSHPDQIHAALSLGVFQAEGKPVILLNLPASRREGVLFTADLLRLATVLR